MRQYKNGDQMKFSEETEKNQEVMVSDDISEDSEYYSQKIYNNSSLKKNQNQYQDSMRDSNNSNFFKRDTHSSTFAKNRADTNRTKNSMEVRTRK